MHVNIAAAWGYCREIEVLKLFQVSLQVLFYNSQPLHGLRSCLHNSSAEETWFLYLK